MANYNKTDLVVFDLDNTLIDSNPKLTSDVVGAFARLGRQITPEEVSGNWYDLARKYGFSSEQFDREFDKRKPWEESLKAGEVNIFSEVYETLEGLKQRNTRLALLSRSNREYTDQKIDHFGLRPYFEHIKVIDVKAPSKRDGALELIADLDPKSINKVLFVGDREEDVVIARDVQSKYGLSSEGVYVSRNKKPIDGYTNIQSLKELTGMI